MILLKRKKIRVIIASYQSLKLLCLSVNTIFYYLLYNIYFPFQLYIKST